MSKTGPMAVVYPVDLDQLRQVAMELDEQAVHAPCSEAAVIRDAADEIERLDALAYYYISRGWPSYTETDRKLHATQPDWNAQSRAAKRHMTRALKLSGRSPQALRSGTP